MLSFLYCIEEDDLSVSRNLSGDGVTEMGTQDSAALKRYQNLDTFACIDCPKSRSPFANKCIHMIFEFPLRESFSSYDIPKDEDFPEFRDRINQENRRFRHELKTMNECLELLNSEIEQMKCQIPFDRNEGGASMQSVITALDTVALQCA